MHKNVYVDFHRRFCALSWRPSISLLLFLTSSTESADPCPIGWNASYLAGCIKVFHTAHTWHDARKVCQRTGGDLIKILDASADKSLRDSLKNETGDFWIGLKRERSYFFKWLDDDSKAQYFHWYPIEPTGLTLRCAYMEAGTGNWHPSDCRHTTGFICGSGVKMKFIPQPEASHVESTGGVNYGVIGILSVIAVLGTLLTVGYCWSAGSGTRRTNDVHPADQVDDIDHVASNVALGRQASGGSSYFNFLHNPKPELEAPECVACDF